MVTVKIERNNYYYNNSYVTIDGQTYTGANNTAEITVPIGTVIYCHCIAGTKNGEDGDITLNGVSVEPTTTGGMTSYYEYEYTVNGNVTISFDYAEGFYSYIAITEIRNDPATVVMTNNGNYALDYDGGMVSVAVNGKSYGGSKISGTVEVAAGTVITIGVYCEYEGRDSYIYLNGKNIFSTKSSGSYKYTVTGNTTIHAIGYDDSGYAVSVYITET